MPNNVTVEERVVEMRIDNKKFEAGAKKTINILEQLEKGLQGIGKQNADGFDNIGDSLDKVTNRFSTFGIVGDQVIRNLTNKAMELVGQLKNVSTMLTTQQVGAGWNKYAEKVEAVQTIMASTNNLVGEGLKWSNQEEQLEGVNEQLERLTWFADETSYSFTDMVNNVGKFTAAGRELEESVTAMQGISAWAAISGGKPAEASRAMYNLSQALGLGAVTNLDWKSIELANMATYEFKQQAIDTAVELHRLNKVADGVWETVEGNYEVTVEKFRDTLTFGKGEDKVQWFDADVLLTVLNRYGDFAQIVKDVQTDFEYPSATYVLKDLKDYEASLEKAGEAEKFLKKRSEELNISFDELKSALDYMLQPEFDLGRRAFQAAQEAKTFREAIDATKDAVSTKWMDVFELLFGNYLEAKELWTHLAEVLWDVFAQPVDHLIEILEAANGFGVIDEVKELFSFSGEASESVEHLAGSTDYLNSALGAAGKSMKDFEDAMKKTLSPQQLVDILEKYGSIEDALLNGAFSADQFKKALGSMDDGYDKAKTVGLNRALAKAGKSMEDFENAVKQAADPAVLVKMLNQFPSIEDALRNGAISADLFKKALESIGIESDKVVPEVEAQITSAVGSLEEMRKLALEVLRGDHGNGEERLAWYKEMGLDAELMQAMAGDLKNFGYYISDEELLDYMEQYYQHMGLSARLGYETFAEYLAATVSSAKSSIDSMDALADQADDIYASLFGSDVRKQSGELYSAGELFRMGLDNLIGALDNFATTFDEVLLTILGGETSIETLGQGFFTVAAGFYNLTKRIKNFTESDSLKNILSAFLTTLHLIRKVIGVVFKIAGVGLRLVIKILSPVFKIITSLFNAISEGVGMLSMMLDESGFIGTIIAIGDTIAERLQPPIDKVCYVIDRIVEAFKNGFKADGLAGGIRSVSEAVDILFQNHPIFLKVFHAMEKVATLAGKALNFAADAIKTIGLVIAGMFGGVIYAIGAAFNKIVEWASNSELLAAIWNKITEAVMKFGRVIKRVWGYAEQGYKEGGFLGALSAVAASFERGVKRIVPHGEKIIEIFDNIKSVFTSLFKKKTVDENGVVQTVDDTENSLIKLEETADRITNVTRAATEGMLGDEQEQQTFRQRVKTLVGNMWKGFLEGLREIRLGDAINILRLSVFANLALKIIHSLDIFNQLGENIREIPENLSWTIENIALTFKSLAVSFRADAIVKFAVAAGIVAGAIWILSNIPDDKLEKASSVVISILSVLSLLAFALGRTSSSIFKTIRYMPALGAALIGFAAVVSSIGTTVLILSLISKFAGVEHLNNAVSVINRILLTIGAIIAAIVLIVKSKDFGAYKLDSIGTMMRRIGLGLMSVALAMQMLMVPILAFSLVLKFARGEAGIMKFQNAVAATAVILLVLGALVAILVASVHSMSEENIKAVGKLFLKVGLAMTIVAFAMQMLIVPIITIAALQKYIGIDETRNAVIAVAALLGYLAVLVGIFAWFLNSAGYSNMKEIGKTLLRTAAAMLIVVIAIRLLVKPIIEIAELSKQIEDVFIIRSILYLLGAISAIGLVLAGLNRLGKFYSGDALLHIAGAIALLSFSMLILTPALILMSAALAWFAEKLGKLDKKTWDVFLEGLKRLALFAGALIVVGLALFAIGVGSVAAAAGIISVAVAVFLFAAAVSVMLVAFPKVVEAFERLKELDGKELKNGVAKAAIAIGGLLTVILIFAGALFILYKMVGAGVLKKISDKFIEMVKSIGSGVQTGVKTGLTKLIEYLKNDENKKAILAAIESLILVGAAYVAGVLPTVAHVIIGGIVGLIHAISTELESQSEPIVEAITRLVSAALNIVGGLIGNLFSADFWNSLNGVSKWLLGVIILLGIIKGISAFSSMISAITGAGGIIAGLGAVGWWLIALIGLAAAVAIGFHNMKKELAEEADERNVELFGEKDPSIEKRAEQLDELQKKYDEFIEKDEELKRQMADAQKAGDNEAYHAAEDEYIARAQERAKYISDVDVAYEQLANDLADAVLPDDAGWWERSRTIRNILAEMKESGGDMSKVGAYQKYLSMIEQTNAAQETELETTRKLSDADEVRTEKFATKRQQRHEEIEDIQEETSAIQALEETTDSATNSMNNLDNARQQVIDVLSEEGLSVGDVTVDGQFDLSKLSEGAKEKIGGILQSFVGDGMSDFDLSAQLSEWGFDGLGEQLKGKFSGIGEYIPSGLGLGVDNGIGSFLTSLFGAGDAGENTMMESLEANSPSERFARVGEYIPAGLGVGIERNYYTAVNPLYTLIDEMTTVFDGVERRFYNSGVQVVQGLIDGISNSFQAAYNTGSNLAESVENGFNERLQIRSPSRVFMEIAKYIPMGVSQGIQNGEGEAIDSIVVLGDALIQAISRSMAQVGVMADSDFSISPTITPVVDLSNINSASGAINGMFGKTSLRSLDRVSAAQAERMANITYNNDNEMLTGVVSNLSDKVDILGERISNMQIVLDSGVLVGATSAQMDRSLATRQARSGRGN